MLRNSIINVVLKIGLSVSLLYAALASFIVPARVTSRWPLFIAHRVDEGTLSSLTGILCITIIVWLFFGQRKFFSALATTTAIGLAGLFNIESVSFLFSLAPLFFVSLALCIRYYPRVRIVTETFVTPLHEGNLDGEKASDITGFEIIETTVSKLPRSNIHLNTESDTADAKLEEETRAENIKETSRFLRASRPPRATRTRRTHSPRTSKSPNSDNFGKHDN